MEIHDIERAFQALGVSLDASEEEISKAFRERSKKTHPDGAPGDEGAAQRALNGAVETARKYVEYRTALVRLAQPALVPIEKHLLTAQKELEERVIAAQQNESRRQERAESVRNDARQRSEVRVRILYRRVDAMRNTRMALFLTGIIGIVVAGAGEDLIKAMWALAIQDPLSLEAAVRGTRIVLSVASIGLGIVGLVLRGRIVSYERAVEDLLEQLSDPATCALLLLSAKARSTATYRWNQRGPVEEQKEVLSEELLMSAIYGLESSRPDYSVLGHMSTVDALIQLIAFRSRHKAVKVAVHDQMRLLVLKAVEHGLLTPLIPFHDGERSFSDAPAKREYLLEEDRIAVYKKRRGGESSEEDQR